MTNYTFTLLNQEELVNHLVLGSRLYNIEYFVSNDIHGDLSRGRIEVVVNENGTFPNKEQLNENVNTVIRNEFIVNIKEYVKGLE
ncbi:hypothetical protein [Neobacillus drentensis]|uniref:hypothetical protein n=1 Tax=Neobacillus drentensis TaxID=220684 RepID=UPI0028594178|nr:hypothetical protein [Neobacillus drentensis]MDR7235693.1 hypothetical protein [Neobacillus drentensis]